MNKFISNYANIPNPTTKFFNKIEDVSIVGDDHTKTIEWLEAMKKVPLYVKSIKICSNNAEELENLTDSNLHNTPISNLRLELKSFNISAKTVENLQTICPNSITISDDSISIDETMNQILYGNFTKLLSKLDNTSLEMDFNNNHYKIYFEFNDVIFKVVESNEECSYIRAKSVEIRCIAEEFCWIT